MVVYPDFADHARDVLPYLDRADIGLHLTLTTDAPFGEVFRNAYLRRPDLATAIRIVDGQVSLFEKSIGRPPAYIDGHRHVHLFPVIREAVVRVAARIGAYVRLTREPIDVAMAGRPAPFEAACLSLMARPIARLAMEHRVAANRGFRGIRSFREPEPFRHLFRAMLAGARDGHLVMCHPGLVDRVLIGRDGVHEQREGELRYLAGPDFQADLASLGVTIARLREIFRT
jgi:hypothetical protein